jgi:hypothetical protein
MPLNRNDLDALRKIINDEITKGTPRAANLTTPALSPDARAALGLITDNYIIALRAMRTTMTNKGANDTDLIVCGPIF